MDDGNGSNRTFRILSGKLEKLVPYNHLGTGFEGSIVPLIAHKYILTDSRVLKSICLLHPCDVLYFIVLYCTDAEDAVRGRDGYQFDGQRLRCEIAKGDRGGGGGGGGGRDRFDGTSSFSVLLSFFLSVLY